MRPPLIVSSATNPRLKEVLELRRAARRRVSGQCVIEGRREILRALTAGLRMVTLFGALELLGKSLSELETEDPAWAALPTTTGVIECPEAAFRKIAYRENPEGVLAIVEVPRWPAPEAWPLGEAGEPAAWLIAESLEKPGNLGALARIAAAAGFTGIVVVDGVVDAFNPNAIRASTGAVFSLPILPMASSVLGGWLAARGIRLFLASPEAAQVYTACDFRGPVAIGIGAEAMGLSAGLRELVTAGQAELVAIPMNTARVDSLNAAVTAAVLAFEVLRQRQ